MNNTDLASRKRGPYRHPKGRLTRLEETNMQFRQATHFITTFLAASLIAASAHAGGSGPSEADELAKKLSNPTAANASLSNNFEYTAQLI